MQGNSLTIGFKGAVKLNGIPAHAEGGNRHIDTVGGVISHDNTLDAHFGRIVSVHPAAPNEFIVGWAPGLVVVGPLLNDQGIQENDPAKPDYLLNEQPATAVIKGGLWFASWGKTAGGAIDPVIGAIVIFKMTTGLIEFLADGSAVPDTFKPLLAAVTKTDFLANGVCINFEPQSYSVLPTEDVI